jgi:hypothetical protein
VKEDGMKRFALCAPLLLSVACAIESGDSNVDLASVGSLRASDVSAPCEPRSDERGLYAEFDVVGERFHTSITNATGITQAIALWQGRSHDSIPMGTLVCPSAATQGSNENCPWHWTFDPASVHFAFGAIEVCDGTPSYVEGHCRDFNFGYCPWSARLIELRDCRTDPGCPLVPRAAALH